MIIITGAAGFIGSCLTERLNQTGQNNIVVVDDFSKPEKKNNYDQKSFAQKIERTEFIEWLDTRNDIEVVLHIGARTDTTEFDMAVFEELNIDYSKKIWKYCVEKNVPLIYASSAATYGGGEKGYDDQTDPGQLQPLNPYGFSKNIFDDFVLHQTSSRPSFWCGLKFFNVYGPNEYHKGRMASVIFHAFNQFKKDGSVKLFKSHRDDFRDGMQMRDFIYVKDVVDVIIWLMEHKPASGIYNLGTGKARTFYDLASATASAMNIDLKINWIDIPEDIRDKYQYFTEAKMDKLFNAGYSKMFYSLEDGVSDYVKNYLLSGKYY